MGTRKGWLYSLLCAVFAVGLLGCGDDPETYSVSGIITRSVEPDPALGGDGIGDVYLELMVECPSLSGCLTEVVSNIDLEDVDLSAPGASVPFEATGIPNGTYYLSGLLNDAFNTINPERISETGDLVMFGLAAPRCVEVTVAGGNVTGVSADFNSVMPFALPMDDVICDEPEDEDDPDIVDDGDTYTVSVTVARTVPPFLGGDGIGPLRIGLLAGSCFKTDGSQGDMVAERIFEDPPVDLSAPGSTFQFDFVHIPNGVYFVNGFIDDVTNATEQRPLPAVGDLVSFKNLGPGCVKVIVDGADVTAEPYPLNMVLPFDLNDM